MTTPQYSLTKGLGKGIIWILTVAVSFLTVSGYADISVWDLVEQHIKPIVGTLTLGGFLTMTLNYLKVRLAQGGIKS